MPEATDTLSVAYCPVPINGNPTEVLANRFSAWRKIIRALLVYFKEAVSVQEEVCRQHVRLGTAVNFPFFANGTADMSKHTVQKDREALDPQESNVTDSKSVAAKSTAGSLWAGGFHQNNTSHEDEAIRGMFQPYGHGSIADLPGDLIAYHRTQAAHASQLAKELAKNLIPRLDDLRRDLLVKIKEIKGLASDFKNTYAKEQGLTEQHVAALQQAIKVLTGGGPIQGKQDPALVRYQLEKQLGRQISEENYLQDAYTNLQNSGKELEKVVVMEIQQALDHFAQLNSAAATALQQLVDKFVVDGFVAREPAYEWTAFVASDPNFVDTATPSRALDEIEYPYRGDPLTCELRSGQLERRSKYLKSYSRAFYVLTPSFLHEFKSGDRAKHPVPVMSLALDECQISADSKSSGGSHKFVLKTKQGDSSRGHNWVFRVESADALQLWMKDIQTLTSIKDVRERALKFNAPRVAPSRPSEVQQVNGHSNNSNPHNHISNNSAVPPHTDSAPTTSSTTHNASNAIPTGIATAAATPAVAAAIPKSTTSSAIATDSTSVNNTDIPALPHSARDMSGSLLASAHRKHMEEPQQVFDEPDEFDNPADGQDPLVAEKSNFGYDNPRNKTIDDYEENQHVGEVPRVASRQNSRKFSVDQGPALPGLAEIKAAQAAAGAADSAVFEYDAENPDAGNTLKSETGDFVPAHADVPVNVERRLTMSNHKDEEASQNAPRDHTEVGADAQEVIERQRKYSVSSTGKRGPPSRKATGSYGTTDDLKPLSEAQPADSKGSLFFANGLPETTSGAK
ncbi:Phosphatidylinositol 4,5-bisphosphate-binding protein [Yarrowia sp. C11]|nr:Phosphatidylinositol 4,5-bisphosphate-binding protein [Yarrowia sp. E02]KAG5369293.1 Phosphatidylinositol 4,5-bisphosphate-binding protein [Yarrowia sp. C11]